MKWHSRRFLKNVQQKATDSELGTNCFHPDIQGGCAGFGLELRKMVGDISATTIPNRDCRRRLVSVHAGSGGGGGAGDRSGSPPGKDVFCKDKREMFLGRLLR